MRFEKPMETADSLMLAYGNRAPQLRHASIGLALVLFSGQAPAQLNENCTVSILNRNARVDTNGNWRIDNVPIPFGPVRARATCVNNGFPGASRFPVSSITGVV